MEGRNNEHNIIITLQRATLWLRTDRCSLSDLPAPVEPEGRKNERTNDLHIHTHLPVFRMFHHCAVASEFLLASTYNLLQVVIR